MKNKSPRQEMASQKSPIFGFLIVFILGFICGVVFAAFKLNQGTDTVQQAGQQSEVATAIAELESHVTGQPEDYQSWVHLGHLYFDSGQSEKAITAYTTSLKYHEGSADLFTDLGIMYRRTGNPEKAVESFKKAQAMDPRHLMSRLNEGIVRHFDLKDTAGALAAWEALLAIEPEIQLSNGEKLSSFIDNLRANNPQQ